MRIAIFLSGRGSDFIAIYEAIKRTELDATISLVVSNNPDAPGISKAIILGIPTAVFDRKEYTDGETFGEHMLATLNEHKIQFIVLAGYLRKIPPIVIRNFQKRIVNIHPALLPKFGGKGMYGINVHAAVIEAGESATGITIHYIDEVYDNGEIIAQIKIPVLKDDTPELLAQRVLEVEHEFYPQILQTLFLKLKNV